LTKTAYIPTAAAAGFPAAALLRLWGVGAVRTCIQRKPKALLEDARGAVGLVCAFKVGAEEKRVKKDGFFCCFVENVLILHLSSKKTFYSKTNLTDLL
jgi:hypothetical protein